MKIKNKKIVLTVLGILIVLLSVIGATYAYYSAKIKENNKTETVIKTNELNIVFTGTQEINCSNIIPGDSCIKKFTVENISNVPVEYNIYMAGITNEFNEDLVYTLEDETGSVVGETPLPVTNKNKSYLKTAISIEANTKKTYTMKILYKYLETSQDNYQGKTFKGTLGIDSNKVELKPEVNAISFADDDWDTIQKAVQSGTYPYQVGDTKTIDMGEFGTHTLRIANTSACTTETSETACGLVVEFMDIIITYNMNTSLTNVGGWPASSVRKYINEIIYKALPSNLQNAVIDTKVISSHGNTLGETNFESTDKLYLLSPVEIWNSGNGFDTADNESKQLDYYKNISVTIHGGATKEFNGSKIYWWLRDDNSNTSYNFFCSGISGEIGADSSTNYYGISPAFRIG